jgi:hypothetical protein
MKHFSDAVELWGYVTRHARGNRCQITCGPRTRNVTGHISMIAAPSELMASPQLPPSPSDTLVVAGLHDRITNVERHAAAAIDAGIR